MDIKFTLMEAEGELFVNREQIVDEMVKTLSDPHLRMGFALYGSRRIGKSSIFLEVRRRLKKKPRIVPVYFNLWELYQRTLTEFNQEISKRILQEYGPLLGLKHNLTELKGLPRKAMHAILKHLKLEINLVDDIGVLLTYREESEPDPNSIKTVLRLVERLAKKTNTRCVLMLDEFPTITELKCGTKIGEGVIGMIRAIHARQKHTLLCIAGSSKSTMDSAVLSPTSPFYRQFIIKEIKPLEKKYVSEIITRNIDWEITKEAIDRIYEFTNGIPYYVQFIGRHIYMSRKSQITKDDLDDIIEDFLKQEGDLLLTRDLEVLSPGEIALLEAMIQGGTGRISELAKINRERISNTYTTVRELLKKGVIEKKSRGCYEFTDPIFRKWLRKRVGE